MDLSPELLAAAAAGAGRTADGNIDLHGVNLLLIATETARSRGATFE